MGFRCAFGDQDAGGVGVPDMTVVEYRPKDAHRGWEEEEEEERGRRWWLRLRLY